MPLADRNRPDAEFDDPMKLVDFEEVTHDERLDLLQTWLARVADGRAMHGSREEVEGAILALEARAKLKTDPPPDAPLTHNYGVVQRTDHRDYGLWTFFRSLFRWPRR